MKLVSFRIPVNNREKVRTWLGTHILESASYTWVDNILTFEHEVDALNFMLVFGVPRHETLIEKMLKNETSNN